MKKKLINLSVLLTIISLVSFSQDKTKIPLKQIQGWPLGVTGVEIGRLDNIQDTVQKQLDSKLDKDSLVSYADYFYTKQQVQALPTQPSFEQAIASLGTTMKALPVNVNTVNLFSGTSAMTSGAVYFVYFNVTDTISVTGVRWIQRNAFVGTGDAYNGFGLYSVSAGTYTFITQTVTDNDLWKVSDFATGTKAWPTQQILLPGKYMVAILWHASATSTAPTIYSHGTISANHGVFLTNSNKISSYISSQTALPNPTTTGSATTVNSVIWGIWLY